MGRIRWRNGLCHQSKVKFVGTIIRMEKRGRESVSELLLVSVK